MAHLFVIGKMHSKEKFKLFKQVHMEGTGHRVANEIFEKEGLAIVAVLEENHSGKEIWNVNYLRKRNCEHPGPMQMVFNWRNDSISQHCETCHFTRPQELFINQQ